MSGEKAKLQHATPHPAGKPADTDPHSSGNPAGDIIAIRQQLDAAITRIEKRPLHIDASRSDMAPIRVPTGIGGLDAMLNPDAGNPERRGIVANALHEVRASTGLEAASAAGFALCLGLLLAKGLRSYRVRQNRYADVCLPGFWICDRFIRHEYGAFYGPGLAPFGLAPDQLIRIHPQTREEALWAAGEIAAAGNDAGFCLIEISGHPRAFDLTTSRRLMLRAQSSQVPVIVLRQSSHEEASAATTRWHVGPAPSRRAQGRGADPLMHQFIGPPAFSVCLEKCRSTPGASANSTKPREMEWNPDDQCFAPLSRSLSTRPLEPEPEKSGAAPAIATISPACRRA